MQSDSKTPLASKGKKYTPSYSGGKITRSGIGAKPSVAGGVSLPRAQAIERKFKKFEPKPKNVSNYRKSSSMADEPPNN